MPAEAAPLTASFRGALAVTEVIDDRATRQTVKGICIHMVPFEEITAEFVVVAVERSAARSRIRTRDVLSDVMAGVEHERGAALHADVADAEKKRAG